jgi:hypothetical protein
MHLHNHRIHEDPQMNTVLGEIKKWSFRYFRKLDNKTNALSGNQLDNSKTAYRLKRYWIITLPDRLE